MIAHFRIAPIIAASALALASGVAGAASPDAPIGVGPLGSLRDLGRAPASTRVDVAVVLRYRNDAELEALVRAQGDPDSPLHGRFLTQGQFQRYFSPSRADEARVIASLERAGFTTAQRFANRTVVDASAPAPVAERYFATEIHLLVLPGEGIKYANVRPGFVPAALRDVVLGVTGLSSVHVAHPDYVLGPRAPRAVQAIADGKPLFGPDGGYGPGVFTKSYHRPRPLVRREPVNRRVFLLPGHLPGSDRRHVALVADLRRCHDRGRSDYRQARRVRQPLDL